MGVMEVQDWVLAQTAPKTLGRSETLVPVSSVSSKTSVGDDHERPISGVLNNLWIRSPSSEGRGRYPAPLC